MTTKDAAEAGPAQTADEPWPAGRPVLVKALQWLTWRLYAAHEIGKHGLYLRTGHALPVGTRLELEILWKGHPSILVPGTVHACFAAGRTGPPRRPSGWCVALADLPTALQRRLDAFVEEIESQEDLPAVPAAAAAAPLPAAPGGLRPSGLFPELAPDDDRVPTGAVPLDPARFRRRNFA
jgi:hypothetical protein